MINIKTDTLITSCFLTNKQLFTNDLVNLEQMFRFPGALHEEMNMTPLIPLPIQTIQL